MPTVGGARDQSAWVALGEELVAEGIPIDRVGEHRSEITTFLRGLMLRDPEDVEDSVVLEKLRSNDFCIEDEDALPAESEEALRWAAGEGRIDVIKYLTRVGVNINAKDKDESTALHHAVWAGQTDTVDFLLQSDARADSLRNVKLRDNVPKTFIKSTLLMDAVEHGRMATIKFLITKELSLGPAEPKAATPVHIAAANNHYGAMRLLLKAEADINARSSDHADFTALQIAVKNGSISMSQYLLKSGASTDVNGADNKNKNTLLHEALDGPLEESRKLSLCRLLVDANVSARAARPWDQHRAPLSVAVSQGLTTIVEYLLSRGADPDVIDNSKSCPLMLTIISKAQLEVKTAIILMLQRAGADMDAISLEKAVIPKYGSFVRKTALQCAVEMQQLSLVKSLLQFGANPNVCSSSGGTPLLSAAQFISPSEPQLEIMKALINASADLNYVHPSQKKSLLHFASQAGNLEAVKFLASKRVDINLPNENGNTPLMSYLEVGKYKNRALDLNMIKQLIDSGAKINNHNLRTGATVLHRAAFQSDQNVLEFFLKSGVPLNALDKYQANALHWAAYSKESGNIQLLLKVGVNPTQQLLVKANKFYPIDIAKGFERKGGPMTKLLAPVSPTNGEEFWEHRWEPGRHILILIYL